MPILDAPRAEGDYQISFAYEESSSFDHQAKETSRKIEKIIARNVSSLQKLEAKAKVSSAAVSEGSWTLRKLSLLPPFTQRIS